MKKQFIFIGILFFSSLLTALGQSSTILPGIILPQMTTAQRTALASPQNGVLVYDTDSQSYWFSQNGAWVNLSAGGGGSNYWQLSGIHGDEIRNTNTGGIWSANATALPSYATDATNPLTAPMSGAGTRMMWIPSRSAFRVGTAEGYDDSYWDAANIGLFSFATGYNTTASGKYSTAIGNTNVASGYNSTAMGYYTFALGYNSTAMGYYNYASGDNSTAMGSRVNTNGQPGSFIIGDGNPYNQGPTYVGFPNQFVARFANGYYLMTSGDTGNPSSNVRTGIMAGPGANAWSAISDSTKKEKHLRIDSEGLLHKIAKFRLTTWNCKGQDPKVFRHYGPMAQDFYAAFGKDGYGTIGCDTLINQADFDGINFAAVQALVKRTDELTRMNEELKLRNDTLEQRLARLEKEWVEAKRTVEMTTTGKKARESHALAISTIGSNQ